jgi:hypothetical protein
MSGANGKICAATPLALKGIVKTIGGSNALVKNRDGARANKKLLGESQSKTQR